MGWLSLYTLDRKDIKELEIKDTYKMHQAVYGLFPDYRDRDSKPRILYADKGFSGVNREIVILSEEKPIRTDDPRLKIKKVPEDFLNFRRYNFDIVINPVRMWRDQKIVEPIRGEDTIREWFAEKSWNWGFEPKYFEIWSVWVDKFEQVRDRKLPNGETEKIKLGDILLQKARIVGSLAVTDPVLFRRSFNKGIGRGKGFGCGLLQLRIVG